MSYFTKEVFKAVSMMTLASILELVRPADSIFIHNLLVGGWILCLLVIPLSITLYFLGKKLEKS